MTWLQVVPAHGAEPIRLAMVEAFSGPFANAGEAVAPQLLFAVERVTRRRGEAAGGARLLQLETLDSRARPKRGPCARATDDSIPSFCRVIRVPVAAALIDAVNKHHERVPEARAIRNTRR